MLSQVNLATLYAPILFFKIHFHNLPPIYALVFLVVFLFEISLKEAVNTSPRCVVHA
jgi:hypothetical protein